MLENFASSIDRRGAEIEKQTWLADKMIYYTIDNVRKEFHHNEL